MDTKQLAKLFTEAEGKKVLVIGDLIVDEYVEGTKAKISPEAPVPAVYGRIKRWTALGGAANVAEAVTRLGGKPMLFSLTGDIGGLPHSCEVYNMFNRKPPIKTRIVCNGHHICRLDEEVNRMISQVEKRRLIDELDEVLKEFEPDACILADYGKSGITSELFNEIYRSISAYCYYAEVCMMFIVDSKTPYPIKPIDDPRDNVDLLFTPNMDEWAQYVARNGKTCNTLVTLGAAGLEYIENDGNPRAALVRPFSSPTVADVCGAGDVVTATCAMLLSPNDAAYGPERRLEKIEAAQLVAETSVQKFGVNPPFLVEVLDYAAKALREA